MNRAVIAGCAVAILAAVLSAQKKDAGVSTDMLVNPPPEDWWMYSRTYDAQRYSPLELVNRRNVPELKTAWTKVMPNGNHESIPIVSQGGQQHHFVFGERKAVHRRHERRRTPDGRRNHAGRHLAGAEAQ